MLCWRCACVRAVRAPAVVQKEGGGGGGGGGYKCTHRHNGQAVGSARNSINHKADRLAWFRRCCRSSCSSCRRCHGRHWHSAGGTVDSSREVNTRRDLCETAFQHLSLVHALKIMAGND
jgi:hypothetical protein